MGSSLLDVCRFNPTAGGTADWTYASAVTGYQGPAAAGAVNGATYSLRAESADLSQWELSTGAYDSGTGVFARTTVLYNSSGTGTLQGGAGTKINFSTVPRVAIVALAEDLAPIDGGAKALGFATVAAGVLTNRVTFNMTLARTGTGTYTATFAKPFDGIYYPPLILPSKAASIMFPAITSQTASVLSFTTFIAPGFTADDVDKLSVVCFGRQ